MKYVLIGNHPSVRKIRELIQMVSETAFNVLVLGETGTGKEVVARLLHRASPRQSRRFVKVNCAALPLTLLESELFGYEKGAFTGADRLKPGKFELASEGVMLLDEIGDMPLVLQSKLLHVLQNGEFNRLGGTSDIKVNAWVIASTNHDLEKDMKQGLFREDLYYRINIIKIELPPLRDRKEDIPVLTEYFLKKHRENLGLDGHGVLTKGMVEFFQTYHWPGNVRELSGTVLRLLIGDDHEAVHAELLENMGGDGLPLPLKFNFGTSGEESQTLKTTEFQNSLLSLKTIKTEATRYIEKEAILNALDKTGWNKRKAAGLLKVSYKALFNKLNDYDIRNNSGNQNNGC